LKYSIALGLAPHYQRAWRLEGEDEHLPFLSSFSSFGPLATVQKTLISDILMSDHAPKNMYPEMDETGTPGE